MNCDIKCEQFVIKGEDDPLSVPEIKTEPLDIRNEVKMEVEESQTLSEQIEIKSEMRVIHNFIGPVETISEDHDICGEILNHPNSVYHKEVEQNKRIFVCNECSKEFRSKQLLQRHLSVHSEDRPFVCKLCGAGFKTMANLVHHQPTHTGEKKYICKLCGQQFAYKTSLTLHHRWHTGQKPYQCHVCNKNFSSNSNLQQHLRIHTGEKPYCCDSCGSKFTSSSKLKSHVKRHTGERPWKCEFCSKSFLYKHTWMYHTKRHKGEKPFQCHYCAHSFTEKWVLKKHLRVHTGERPYSCTMCGKAYAHSSNLTKHKKVHRNSKDGNVSATRDISVDRTVVSHLSKEGASEKDAVKGEIKMEDDGDREQQITDESYQDPEDPSETKTLHIIDNMKADPEVKTENQGSEYDVSRLVKKEEAIEFLTQDGEEVSLVMSYEVDPLQLNADYLATT